jgi:hypothetical protein
MVDQIKTVWTTEDILHEVQIRAAGKPHSPGLPQEVDDEINHLVDSIRTNKEMPTQPWGESDLLFQGIELHEFITPKSK